MNLNDFMCIVYFVGLVINFRFLKVIIIIVEDLVMVLGF